VDKVQGQDFWHKFCFELRRVF